MSDEGGACPFIPELSLKVMGNEGALLNLSEVRIGIISCRKGTSGIRISK